MEPLGQTTYTPGPHKAWVVNRHPESLSIDTPGPGVQVYDHLLVLEPFRLMVGRCIEHHGMLFEAHQLAPSSAHEPAKTAHTDGLTTETRW